MIHAKSLLLTQTAQAFLGRPDMPLLASLDGISQPEATWQPDDSTPSIEHLVRHIAWAKSRFCHEGFARPMVLLDESVNADGDSPGLPPEFHCGAAWGSRANPGIDGAIKLLKEAHQALTECLQSCPEDSLEKPIPTRHGKSAVNFFWIMMMHDLYHAGQIRTRRTLFQITMSRT